MCAVSVHVSDNTRVFEIDNGVVNEELGGRGWVENIEVVIFDPRAIEIGGGMCLHMKRNGVFRVSLFADSYDVSVNPNLPESNVMCYLILSILIEKDKRVLPHITTVVLAPPDSWVIWVVELLSKLGNVGDGTQGGRERDGGIIRSESDWFIVLNVFLRHVTLNLVKDLRDEEEVFDGGIVTKGGGEDLVVELSIPQNINCWEEILHPS